MFGNNFRFVKSPEIAKNSYINAYIVINCDLKCKNKYEPLDED